MANLFILLMVFGPAVIGLLALIFGVTGLANRAGGDEQRNPLRTVFSVLALLLALGIGACYASVFLGDALR